MCRANRQVLCAFAIISLGIFVTHSDARAPNRIIGGSNAEPGEFPYQASVRIYDKNVCGGTIIGKRHILTAAHCIVGHVEAPYSEMTIVTGSYSVKPGTGKSYRVKDIKTHDKYVARTNRIPVKNDIAVIGLRKEIEENDFQRPISLPTSDVPSGVLSGISTGFGRIGYEINDRATILQKFEVIIGSSEDCFDRGVRIQPKQICGIKASGRCSAKGDSGGPLVYNGEITGIISTAAVCTLGIPDVYTKVYSYLDFIKIAIDLT